MNDFQKNFIQAGIRLGYSQEDSESLCNLLPKKLIEETTVFNNESYGYVLAYNNPTIIGNHHHLHNFCYLHLALHTAQNVMTIKQFKKYLTKLADRNRLNDFLYELKPLFNMKSGLPVIYEPCLTKNPLDWCITINGIQYFIEVKYRISGLINQFQQIILGSGIDNFIPTPPDVSKIFKDINKKYPHTKQKNQKFGVWIYTPIKVHKDKTIAYLFKHLPQIDFAVFDGWADNKASILENNYNIGNDLSNALNMYFNDKAFSDYSQPVRVLTTHNNEVE
jgi:hypothetical protein